MDAWHQVSLSTSMFSVDREWPLIGSAPLDRLSLGEEQSHSNAVSVAWSPSYLALHQRPVLAVLTSNLLLSIWAPGQDLRDGSTWKRVAVLNNLITARIQHFSGASGKIERLRNRIRCFAWAKSVPEGRSQYWQSSRVHEIQLLAVGNDAGEVVLLWLLCPLQGFSQWDVRVLRIVDMNNKPRQGAATRGKVSLLAQELESRPSVSHLQWGFPWEVDNRHIHRSWLTELSVDCGGWTTSMSVRMQFWPNADHDQRFPVLSLGDLSIELGFDNLAMDPFTANFTRILEHHSTMFKDIQGLEQVHIKRQGCSDGVHVKVWALVPHPIREQWGLACVSIHSSRLLEYPPSRSGSCFVVISQGKESGREHSPSKALLVENNTVDVLKEVQQKIGNYGKIYTDEVSAETGKNDEEWGKRIVHAVSEATTLVQDAPIDKECFFRETCTICDQENIPFEHLNVGRCTKGHQFGRRMLSAIAGRIMLIESAGRCALTFVVMTKPGISKRCDACDRRFLNQYAILPVEVKKKAVEQVDIELLAIREPLDPSHISLRQNIENHEARAAPTTMAQWLLDQYPTCPYCKGKFIG